MKAILSVVEVIALVAAISAEIFEYSDEKFQEMPIFDPKAEVITATVINPDIKMNIQMARREVEEYTVSLFSNVTPNEGEEKHHPICDNTIGIDFREVGGSLFCKLSLIRVRMRVSNRQTSKYFMVLSLGFGFGQANKPMALEIPVFNTPSKYATPDQKKQFEKWASDNRLGTVSPFDLQQLNNLFEFRKITNDFVWLEKLVSLGIFKRPLKITLQKADGDFDIESYVTRPLVLSRDITKTLAELVDYAQVNT